MPDKWGWLSRTVSQPVHAVALRVSSYRPALASAWELALLQLRKQRCCNRSSKRFSCRSWSYGLSASWVQFRTFPTLLCSRGKRHPWISGSLSVRKRVMSFGSPCLLLFLPGGLIFGLAEQSEGNFHRQQRSKVRVLLSEPLNFPFIRSLPEVNWIPPCG